MKSAALLRLHRLTGVAVAAEKARLAGALAEIAACRGRAGALRRRIAGAGVAEGAGGSGAAELAAAARWCVRLGERARAEEARAIELEAEAAAIRRRLAHLSGRESAVAAMAQRVEAEERRVAERRAEAAQVQPQRAPGQSSSRPSGGAVASAGSPGMA